MTLCLGIIEDRLSGNVLFKNYASTDSPFVLERCEIYSGGPVLASGVLYVARAEDLAETIMIQEDAALISIGMPTEFYHDKPLYLLALEGPENLAELTNEVSRIFFEFNTLEQKLQDSVNKGHGIQLLVEQFAPYLNSNELMIVSSEFRVIGLSNQPSHMCDISGFSQVGYGDELQTEIVTFFKNDIIYNNVRNTREPFLYEPSILPCRCMGQNIFHQGDYTCRVIISEDRSPFRGYEAGLLYFFTSFIRLVFDLSLNGGNIFPQNYLGKLFADMIQGRSVEEWRLENSFAQHGWSLAGPFLCASILPSERDYYNRTIAYYCQAFSRDIKGCSFFEHENTLVCVANLQYYNGSAEKFFSTNHETFRDGNFRVGYSNGFTDIWNLRHYYQQAQIAIQTGLEQRASQWFHRFADMALNSMSAMLTSKIDGQFLCAAEILNLQKYDNKNQTEYVRTLKAYLGNQMNAVKTAKALYIHHNTMEYRLRKIEELAGIDFGDYDQVLYLNISFRFLFKE
jgi:hypothetical protein